MSTDNYYLLRKSYFDNETSKIIQCIKLIKLMMWKFLKKEIDNFIIDFLAIQKSFFSKNQL